MHSAVAARSLYLLMSVINISLLVRFGFTLNRR
jgi:hypothetical protein